MEGIPLEKNRVGQSDIYISPLSLGCMSLGIDKKKALEMIDYALENGINHLDTADLYDFGENEKIVGEAIKHRRDKVIVTTKVGNHFDRTKKRTDWFWDPSKKYIESALQESLKRLQTDYIDIYLLHGGTIDDPIDEVIDTFERLKQSGYIRTYGISSIRPNVIKQYMENSNIDVVMMQYNLLDRRPEELLNDLHKRNISVLARGPLAKGILSDRANKYLDEKGKEGYLEYTQEELLETVQQLSRMTDSLTKLSFQYILHHPAVASAVFGASTKEQLAQNIECFSTTKLSSDTYDKIQKLTKFFQYKIHR